MLFLLSQKFTFAKQIDMYTQNNRTGFSKFFMKPIQTNKSTHNCFRFSFAGGQRDLVRPRTAGQLRQVAQQRHPDELQELGGHEGQRPTVYALGHAQNPGPYVARNNVGRGGQPGRQPGPSSGVRGWRRIVLRRAQKRMGLGQHGGGEQVPQLRDLNDAAGCGPGKGRRWYGRLLKPGWREPKMDMTNKLYQHANVHFDFRRNPQSSFQQSTAATAAEECVFRGATTTTPSF
jgi:hypothetical protein